ncbi:MULTISPECIES: hypothetical protein [Streptomyces]|uniref:Uncharacterized protein n=2 Tax=Streptomyces TaxID=1883 RepID=A0A100Y2Z9_9ACTN|nr:MULTISPECIES: hypothetical protein [Streptomyces]KUH36745.1 hypothetical protein ATE80_21855 [Streptomyces kanasensis]UUS31516.1 hypothetical protein NRO40_12190 [Streptomyces changanensis]
MADYELAHPLYLDVQMMVSFLAYLEGGVHLSSEQTVQKEKLRAGKPNREGEMKLPSLGALLGLESSLSAESGHPVAETAETRVARHHTAASLFNGLYAFLHQDDAILALENRDQLAAVTPGTFVKLSGRYTGNPLEEMLAIFTQAMSYMGDISQSVEDKRSQKSMNRRSGNPQNREQAGQSEEHPYAEMAEQFRQFEQSIEMRFMRKMKEELESSPIHDVVLETASGVRAVLTVSSEYYDAAVAEKLSSGDFIVLGKVTRVVREGESINLSRRTVVGKMEDMSGSVTDAMTNIPGFNLQSNEPFVRYPAVQILPMAIFV